eukprot:3148150-Rhodomonas_salina.2
MHATHPVTRYAMHATHLVTRWATLLVLGTHTSVVQGALLTYAANSNTRNRILGTNCPENAVSCIGFRGVPYAASVLRTHYALSGLVPRSFVPGCPAGFSTMVSLSFCTGRAMLVQSNRAVLIREGPDVCTWMQLLAFDLALAVARTDGEIKDNHTHSWYNLYWACEELGLIPAGVCCTRNFMAEAYKGSAPENPPQCTLLEPAALTQPATGRSRDRCRYYQSLRH